MAWRPMADSRVLCSCLWAGILGSPVESTKSKYNENIIFLTNSIETVWLGVGWDLRDGATRLRAIVRYASCLLVRGCSLRRTRSPKLLCELPWQKSRGRPARNRVVFISGRLLEGPRRALQGPPGPRIWRPRATRKHNARSVMPRLSGGGPLFPCSLPELMKITRFLA